MFCFLKNVEVTNLYANKINGNKNKVIQIIEIMTAPDLESKIL